MIIFHRPILMFLPSNSYIFRSPVFFLPIVGSTDDGNENFTSKKKSKLRVFQLQKGVENVIDHQRLI